MIDYEFRLALPGEKPQIVDFLNLNWGYEHPLINNSQFFEFYYNYDDNLHFAVATYDKKIVCVAGIIYSNKNIKKNIWISIWCADKAHNGAGIALMDTVKSLTLTDNISCNNIRKNTIPFYEFLGFYAGKLEHYYRLNSKQLYTVAVVTKYTQIPVTHTAVLTQISALNDIQVQKLYSGFPTKDNWYFQRRYFDYPFWKYNVYKAELSGKTIALLVTRISVVDGVIVIRIVDYIGKPQDFAKLGGAIDDLLLLYSAEYIDMYAYGIALSAINRAGFVHRNEYDKNIIPNYLQPLVKENTDYYFFTSQKENFMMFKADGDQDRPNISR